MKEQVELRAAKLELAGGRVKIQSVANGHGTSHEAQDNWGCLYAVSYGVGCRSAVDALLDRVEGVARETYRRSPGGVTNRLRQAVRNANRYLYLRNCVRGEEQAVLAALACVAVRGQDVYACGVGPHTIMVVGRGRVRGLGATSAPGPEVADDDWHSNGHLLGRTSKVSDPRFSYRQILPGEQVLIVAGDEEGRFRWAADQLREILEEEEIEAAAQALGELIRQHTTGTALLIRLEENGLTPILPETERDQGWGSRPSFGSRLLGSVRQRRKSIIDRQARESGSPEAVETEKTVIKEAARPRPGRKALPSRSSTHAKGLPGAGLSERSTARLLDSTVELFRLGTALLVSLLLVVRGATWRLLLGVAAWTRRLWDWARRHQLLERMGRGAQLALVSLLAGLKGLVIGILPERQGSTSTYAATARPMARARVSRFQPSGPTRLLIGGLIMVVVFALVGASAIRVKARLQQVEVDRVADEIAAQLALADGEEDLAQSMAALSEAQYLLEQAPASHRESPELVQLSQELAARLDALMGVVRLSFSSELEFEEEGSAARRLLIRGDHLYLLEETGQGLRRYQLDGEGRLLTSEEPWVWELPESLKRGAESRILDLEWVEAGNGRTTPALMMLVSDGYVLELGPDGQVREVELSESDAWQSPQAMATYEGNLYVLDTGLENIFKHVPQGDDYGQPPIEYIQESADINWDQVVDLAIDGNVYLLLADGSVAKFTGGKRQPFPQEALQPPATSALSIFAAPDSRRVVVAEPQAGRLAEFSEQGRLARQYRGAIDGESYLAELQAFTVDARSDRLMVSTPSGLVSAPLPGLPPDTLE